MALRSRFLKWLGSKLERRTIMIDGCNYLHRYYLVGKCLREYFPKARERLGFLPPVYLHWFVRPDHERDLHNHPWKYSASFILMGGYEEIRLVDGVEKRIRRWPGTFNILRASDFHTITELRGEETWTIFFTGPFYQRWGFRKEGRVIPWKQYFQEKEQNQ